MQKYTESQGDNISCALTAAADYLVSGDKALIDLKQYNSVKIIKSSEFLKLFE
jgi:predicted nucleic acid-binding protein